MNDSVQDKVHKAVQDMSREEIRHLRFLLGRAVELMEDGREEQGQAWLRCGVTRVLRLLRKHDLINYPPI